MHGRRSLVNVAVREEGRRDAAAPKGVCENRAEQVAFESVGAHVRMPDGARIGEAADDENGCRDLKATRLPRSQSFLHRGLCRVSDCAKARRDTGLVDFKSAERSMVGLYGRGIFRIGKHELSGVEKSEVICWIRQKDCSRSA